MKRSLLLGLLAMLATFLTATAGADIPAWQVENGSPSPVELPSAKGFIRTPGPQNVQMQVTESGQLRISWDPYPATTGFIKIYQSPTPDSLGSAAWTLLTSMQVSNTEYLFDPGSGGFYYLVYDPAGIMPERFVFVEGGTTAGITVGNFYIDKYELTVGGVGGGGSMPLNYISWFEIIVYCNQLSLQEGLTPCYSYDVYGTNPANWPWWSYADSDQAYSYYCNWAANGYRMPSLNEWRYAALGGIYSLGFNWSGSNNPWEVAWYNGNAQYNPQPVGLLMPNELGLYDMSGNMSEWVWEGGSRRYILGGSVTSFSNECTIWSYADAFAINDFYYLGVRLCRTY